MSRRDAVRVGLFSTAGLLLSNGRTLNAADAPPAVQPLSIPPIKAKAKSVIQIFLWGGMSHNDTWDPKPDAGYDYMGEFRTAIPTNVDGIQIGELFPSLAKQADKFSLIRSMTHRNNGHETAAYLMQTAHAPGERLAYPSVGAVFAHFKSQTYKGMIPPYVVLTQPQGRFSEEGFMGPKLEPFATGGDPNGNRFEVEGVVSRGITDERQRARRALLNRMNTMGNVMADSPLLTASEEAKKQAYELILGQGREVFDLSKEKAELRDRYGRHTFGQDCLAARRLVQAGVPYIVINYPGGWDTHSNHFTTMRRQCPQLDQGMAMLLQDLQQARRLDSPLDSVIKLTDADGKLLAFSDDREDIAAGVNTHTADSWFTAKLPASGTYCVHIGDTARQGGDEYGYRLRISAPQPDFDLRVVPSSIALRTSSTATLTVYAQRKDGFAEPIKLELKNPPPGFSAVPVKMAAGENMTRFTFKGASAPTKHPINLSVVGSAKMGEKEIVREAVPAEDRMQAFLWRHLVPAHDLKVVVFDPSYEPPRKRVARARPPSPTATNSIATATNATSRTNVTLAAKLKFTKSQVARRVRELGLLFEEGVLTEEFYYEKLAECEAVP